MAQMKEERMKMDNDVLHRKIRMEQNEEAKAKIRMYKQYKAQQINELQMRE